MKVQLTRVIWLALSVGERQQLAETFNLVRSGASHVVSNKVESDGFRDEDLEAVTIEKMQEFTENSSDDFSTLFDLTLEQLRTPEIAMSPAIAKEFEEPKVKRGRPKKI